jgi:shikimate dehydrogenase
VTFARFVSNPFSLGSEQRFAAILGANPSHGARSPTLWNAAFAAHGGQDTMLPMDISEDQLRPLLDVLDGDARFIGGAIAAPHKEAVAQWLEARLTPSARRIGAVNCLYRQGGRGPLWGTNTDGEGALVCLEAIGGPVKDRAIVQLGAGGAGRAVAAYLADAGARVTLCVRQPDKIIPFARRIGARTMAWENRTDILDRADIVINTTSLGGVAGDMVEQTPLDDDAIGRLSSGVLIYDINYDPCPSRFLLLAAEHALPTGDGRCMNLEQAVLGFGYAVEESEGRAVTRHAMETVGLR